MSLHLLNQLQICLMGQLSSRSQKYHGRLFRAPFLRRQTGKCTGVSEIEPIFEWKGMVSAASRGSTTLGCHSSKGTLPYDHRVSAQREAGTSNVRGGKQRIGQGGEAGRDRAGVGGALRCGVQGGQAEPLLGQGQGEDQKSISFGVRSTRVKSYGSERRATRPVSPCEIRG